MNTRPKLFLLHCVVCKGPASCRCDFKRHNETTCDQPLCTSHAVSAGPGLRYCLGHPMPQNSLALSP
jgi:hypothetical protein